MPKKSKLKGALWGILILATTHLFVSQASFLPSAHADIDLTLDNSTPVLELSVPTSVGLNLVPASGTDFGVADLVINYGTNNTTGGHLTVGVNNSSLTRSDTITNGSGQTITSPTIGPITPPSGTEGYSEADFRSSSTNAYTLNKWGYKGGNVSLYIPPSSTTDIISHFESKESSSTTTVSLAAKVDTSKQAGTYSTTIVISFTANAPIDDISQVPYMQYFVYMSGSEKADVIDSMVVGQAYEKTDVRDSKTYHIAKLADGKVWMLDNLALDIYSLSLSDLTGSTVPWTNASNTTLGYLKNGNGSNGYATSGVTTSSNFNSYTVPHINTASINTVPSNSAGGDGNNKVGVYYNYCAATAGSYCYNSSSYNANPTEDICPSGWRLPTGGDSGEFVTLRSDYYDSEAFRYSLSLPYSGMFMGTSVVMTGYYNSSWTSYVLGSDNPPYASFFWTDESYGAVSSSNDRVSGLTIRCILQ